MTTPTENRLKEAPQGDPERQAVDSLRGYAYQVTAAALAWLDLGENGRLFLEVAEDYATMADNALAAVQVKDTAASGTVTLQSKPVRDALASFVDLVSRNPAFQVQFHYLTTSEIGQERAVADRPGGEAGLIYWRRAAAEGDIAPLRNILESKDFPESVRSFVRTRDNDTIRADLLIPVHWDCGRPDFLTLRSEFESRLIVVCRDHFALPALDARALANALVHLVLVKATEREGSARLLTRADLYNAIDTATRVSMPRRAVEELLTRASSALAFKDALPPLLLENLARRFGFSHPAAGPDELAAFIEAKSDEFLALQTRFEQIQGIESAVATLVESARAALEAGDFQLADRQLQKAEERQLTSATLAAVTKQSELRVARAQAALLSGNVGIAADFWATAADYFSAFDRTQEAETRFTASSELRGYGYRYRSVPALLAAETALLLTRKIWTREADLRCWCRSTNALGATRWRLSQFDEARFRQHIEGAEDALKSVRSVCSKTILPYYYAIASGNLANIYCEKRHDVSDQDYLSNVNTGICLQLESFEALKKDQHPEEFGIFQHNLGTSYIVASRLLKNEDKKREALNSSVAHLEKSFEVRDPVRALQYWVASSRSLAEALIDRAEIEKGDARLRTLARARAVLDAASAEIDGGEHPNQWAELKFQLARILRE